MTDTTKEGYAREFAAGYNADMQMRYNSFIVLE